MKRRALTSEEREDAARLRRKIAQDGRSQLAISGLIPLNFNAVVRFAKELGCSIEDISPRLAKLAHENLMRTSHSHGQVELNELSGPARDMKWYEVANDKMKRLGVTQEQLAVKIGVTRGAVGHYLRGRREPSLEQMKIISQFLHISMAELTGTAEPRQGHEPSLTAFGVPLLDAHASMGNGAALTDHVAVIEMVSANIVELRRRLTFSAPANLRILAGIGESMAPTINDGDLLLIDVGVNEIKLDAVYVLQKDDELFIKRMQRHPAGGYVMRSDNPLYESYPISNPAAQGFQVLARVLCVWNMHKL
jgi:transcriptional regulator with XRE-family HTH domain